MYYSSLDSDSDDCYGNIPQKVEKLLAKRRAESRPVIEKKCSDDLINLREDNFITSNVFRENEVIVVPDSEDENFDAANLFVSQPIDVPEEITTKRPKSIKASSGIETPTKRGAKRGRGRGAKSGKGKSQSNEVDPSAILESLSNPPRKGAKSGMGKNQSNEVNPSAFLESVSNPPRKGAKSGKDKSQSNEVNPSAFLESLSKPPRKGAKSGKDKSQSNEVNPSAFLESLSNPPRKGAKSGKGKSQLNDVDTSLVLESSSNPPIRSTRANLRIANTSVDDFAAPLTPKKTNSRRGRGRQRAKNSVTESPVQISSSEPSPVHNQASQYSGTSLDHQIALALAFEEQSRGSRSNRGRGRGRRNVGSRPYQHTIPTYSIGNTDEYNDASNNVKLFNNKPQATASPTVDLNDSINNEELSVKVFWQSRKVVKFNIRKLQKLMQIFDHFVKEGGVSREQLLFTYNDKILRPDDTPESIDYNIARFIDGGIISSGVTLPQAITKKPVNVKKGFMLKFQCQRLKNAYEVTVGKEEKLNLAMIKCAEHLELSINSLQFEFDGETIRGNMTPKDLDMESGDCIDVKILNVNK